jgi:hypothetical protein
MPLISTFGTIGAQSYGTRGLQFGGSAEFNAFGDRIAFANNAAFAYGTGNFTLEAWIYPTNSSITRIIWRASDGVYLCTINGGQLYYAKGDGGYAIAAAPTFFAWNHVAVVRNSNITNIYLNGIQYGGVFDFVNLTGVADGALGNYRPAGNNQFFGYITNFRISKQALYTANFTPSLLPFTRTSQGSSTTSLLLNVNSAATLATDSSASGLNGTNTNVTYSALTPYGQPYVTPPTVVVSSATVTPTSTTPTEGQTITINVVGTNTANGTYYYSLQEELGTGALTAGDFTSASLTGSFTISGNIGSFPLTVTRDLLTEGSEIFTIYVRTVSTSGEIIGTSAEITIQDTSITPVFTVTPGSINEGDTETFTVSNVGPDGTYFFTVLNGTTADADFSAVSGSFVVSGSTGGIDNGTGSFNITAVADRTTEGSQTFQVQVRSGSTSGTVVVTSAVQTINDDSLTPFVNITGSTNIAELGSNFGGFPTFTTIQAGNLGPAGTYYYTITGTVTASDFTSNSLSGSFTTSTLNGTGSFTITAAPDISYEGQETFSVQIREGSIVGTVLATTGSLALWDSSFSIAVAPNPASEGNGLNITVTTPFDSNNGLAPGQYWLTFIAGTASATDVFGLPFAVNINSGGPFAINGVVGIANLDGLEGSETFSIGFRQGNPTTGALVGQSALITINASAT